MKVLLVYPSRLISFKCPYCEAAGKIKRETQISEDFKVRCPKCKEEIYIKMNIRKCYRKEISITVHYSLSDISNISDRGARKGKIINISKGGLLIEISSVRQSSEDDYEKQGAILTFLFSLPPNDELLKVKGEIKKIISSAQSSKIQIGAEFVRLEEYSKKQIGFFLLP